jgi:hypothetical protein
MKNRSVIVCVVVALLVLGGGVFYFMNRDDSTSTNTAINNTEVKTAETQVTRQEEKKVITLSSALTTIGATGNAGPVNGNTYTFSGVEYKFDEPSNWQTSLSQRKMACEQGYINTSYQIVTDGSTWFATTNNNSDLAALVNALKGAGIKVEIASYCQ